MPTTILTVFKERNPADALVMPPDAVAVCHAIDAVAELSDLVSRYLFIEVDQLTSIRPQRGFEIQANKRNGRPLRDLRVTPFGPTQAQVIIRPTSFRQLRYVAGL